MIVETSRKGLAALAGVLLLVMMGTTVIDVIGRYFFGKALPGAAEISAVALGLFVFASLPLVNLQRGHITVDLFSFARGSALGKLSRFLALMASAGCAFWIAIEITFLAIDLARHGDTTSFLNIPYAPVAAFMAVTAFAAGVFALTTAAPSAADESTRDAE